MINIRLAQQRGYTANNWLKSYHSFSFGEYHDPNHHHFHYLRVINEDYIAPLGGFAPHSHKNMEIMTYMLSGELTHKDSLNNTYTIKCGEVQFMRAGSGITHSESNLSNTVPAHLLQIWIVPKDNDLTPLYSQRHYKLEEKQNKLCKIADYNDEHSGCFKIAQQATIYCCVLEADSPPIKYPIKASNHIWIQLIRGNLALNNNTKLNAGDGAAIHLEQFLIIAATSQAEFILFDFI